VRAFRTDAPRALIGFASVFGLATSNGGFFPTAWGWATLSLLLVALVALVARQRLVVTAADLAFLGLAAALAAWTALSAFWSSAPGVPLLETDRTLVYVAALAALVAVGGRRSPAPLAAGLLAACAGVCIWALAGRLAPSAAPPAAGLGAYRLTGPVGYWNGLGLLAVLGSLLALGFVAHGTHRTTRALAASSLVVFLATLTFTFSRGSWLALAAGLLVLVVLEPERRALAPRLAAVAAAPALAVWSSSRSPGLTRPGAPLQEAARDGHRLGLTLLALIALACVLVLLADRVPPLSPRAGRALTTIAATVALATLVAAIAHEGGPSGVYRRAVSALGSGDSSAGGSLNGRLFSAAGNGRTAYWRVAWEETKAHPLLGGGAGSYGRWWLNRRPTGLGALDAHDLYLETLAELGPVGLLLLLGMLALPLALLARARRTPVACACGAAYIAFLVHALLDWDWELAGVGLAGLLCGASVLLGAPSRRSLTLQRQARVAAVAFALPLLGFVFVLHVGNVSLARSASARENGNLAAAVREARRAEGWLPWSNQPPLALGEAQLAAGEVEAAAASFRIAIARDRGDWEAWYQLSLATNGPMRTDALRRATNLNPRSTELATLHR
jgi:O-antigen ligase